VPPSASLAQTRRRCVFTSAGDRNVVAGWLPPDGARDFDLFVAFYGEDEARFAELCRLADRVWRIKGGKAQNLRALVLSRELDLSPYTHVWLPDDDLLLAPADIPRLFDLAEHFGFAVCQPAFDPLGKVSYPLTAAAENRAQVRLTSFVEVTCPLFRREELERFLAVFDGSLSGWGLDLWFGHVLGADIPGRFGVIDAVTVFNPHDRQKPGGYREIATLKPNAERVLEFTRAAEAHGIKRLPVKVFRTTPLPPGWLDSNPPPATRPAVPSPTDLSLSPAEREVLDAALTPPPRVAVQWGADGITAALLLAGTDLVVAVDDNAPWVRSCRHTPILAPACAADRLLFASSRTRPDATARSSFGAPGTAGQVLAERGAWPDLLVLPEARLRSALAKLHRASLSRNGRPDPRVLLTAAEGTPGDPGPPWRTVQAAGRFRLLAPTAGAPSTLQTPRFGGLRMTKREADAFRASLAEVRSSYLEWGLGGSTLAALERGAPKVFSVESDPAWAALARGDRRIAEAEASGRLTILTPDLGPVGAWGMPLDAARVAQSWQDYVIAPLRAAIAAGTAPDVVLVDGRFRTACCLAVADFCLAGEAERPLLLLHDADRPKYAPVLMAWERIGTEGSLWLLRMRPDADAATVRTALQRFGTKAR
jgi:hypothetical protein